MLFMCLLAHHIHLFTPHSCAPQRPPPFVWQTLSGTGSCLLQPALRLGLFITAASSSAHLRLLVPASPAGPQQAHILPCEACAISTMRDICTQGCSLDCPADPRTSVGVHTPESQQSGTTWVSCDLNWVHVVAR